MKRFVRDYLGKDWVDQYEFPNIPLKPILVPSKKDLQKLFYALPMCRRAKDNKFIKEPKYHAMFLLLATSGLRFSEVLGLTKANIFQGKRMVIPGIFEKNSTKNSWITFYNVETEERLTWLNKKGNNEPIFVGKNMLYRAFKKAIIRGYGDGEWDSSEYHQPDPPLDYYSRWKDYDANAIMYVYTSQGYSKWPVESAGLGRYMKMDLSFESLNNEE